MHGQVTTQLSKRDRGSFRDMFGTVKTSAYRRLRRFLPPALESLLLRLGFAGNRFRYGYKSWADAQTKCTGYDSMSISESLVQATRRVVAGEAVFERDGVEFDSIQYSWPLLASLLGTPRVGNKIRILDWGGALGSTYRQNKDLIASAGIELQWVIVEQPHLAALGSKEFSDDCLSFFDNLVAVEKESFDAIILSSSLCYVENPWQVLSEIKGILPTAILIDRTPFSSGGKEIIGVQKVGRKIYKASYPIRVFPEKSIELVLAPQYRKASEWICDLQPDPKSISKGMLFLKEPSS